MPFDPILPEQIQTGEPTRSNLFQKIRDGLNDHESRLASVESTFQAPPPIKFVVKGHLYLFASSFPLTAIAHERVWTNLVLTAGRIFVVNAGTAGTLDIDVKYFRNNVWASIFSTRPTAAFGAGSYYTSTNGILTVTNLIAGDVLRLDVNSVQTGTSEFHVELSYRMA